MAVAMAARAAVSTSAWARSPICSRTGSTSAKSPIGVVHRGEHEPILTRDLFEAVQATSPTPVARHVRLRGSAALLAGCSSTTAATG
jgi:hypothetical protein